MAIAIEMATVKKAAATVAIAVIAAIAATATAAAITAVTVAIIAIVVASIATMLAAMPAVMPAATPTTKPAATAIAVPSVVGSISYPAAIFFRPSSGQLLHFCQNPTSIVGCYVTTYFGSYLHLYLEISFADPAANAIAVASCSLQPFD